MSLHSRLVDQVIVLKPTMAGEDVYGNAKDGEPTEETYRGYVFQGGSRQGDAVETRDTQGNTLVTTWQLVIEARSKLTGDMQVKAKGKLFDVVGAPAEAARPGSPAPVLVARLRHVEDL